MTSRYSASDNMALQVFHAPARRLMVGCAGVTLAVRVLLAALSLADARAVMPAVDADPCRPVAEVEL